MSNSASTDVKRWGFHTFITKELVRDSAISIDALLEADFRATLPARYEMLDEHPAFEWLDVDENPDPFGGFTLEDGTEIPPLTNGYRIRGTARIAARP